MALTASTGIQSHVPLAPSSRVYSSLTPHHASLHPATAVEPPAPATRPIREGRSSSFINLPTSLSNLLHLQLSKNKPQVNLVDGIPFSDAADRRTPTVSPKEDISSIRDEIHGDADWSRLLDPLHPWLRREIIKYGEFAQATYDGFDFNPFSAFCGSCLYGRARLFEKLGLVRNGYGVTKYIYAMSHVELPQWLERSVHADTWSKDSNWMGYVAVSDDVETRRIGCRDIVVSWRGTVTTAEWLEDIQGKLEPIGDDHGDVKVEHGFLSIYTSKSEATRYNKSSASEQVMAEIKRLVDYYRGRGEEVSLTITGHSLGGALALLNAYEAASTLPDLPVSVISFGAPRVGNPAFRDRLKDLDVKALRVVVKQDVVPKMPGLLINDDILEKVPGKREWVYAHVGLELAVDVKTSPFLKHSSVDVVGFHSLETYMHLVDGYLGAGKEYRRNAKRDVALVNKATGMLRDELRIPTCWYQSANKGMVCNTYGRWMQPKREPEDIPSPYRNHPPVHPLYA